MPAPAPTNLTLLATREQVALSWTAATGATSYQISRYEDSQSSSLAFVIGETTNVFFTDVSVPVTIPTSGVYGIATWHYIVTSIDATGPGGSVTDYITMNDIEDSDIYYSSIREPILGDSTKFSIHPINFTTTDTSSQDHKNNVFLQYLNKTQP